jgi:hypothetical protein
MLCVAAAALALLLPAASAGARVHVYARTKCVGLYCRIVTEPPPATLPADRRKGRALGIPDRARACMPCRPA